MRLITRSMLVTLLTALIGGCAISGGDPVPPPNAPHRAMAPARMVLRAHEARTLRQAFATPLATGQVLRLS